MNIRTITHFFKKYKAVILYFSLTLGFFFLSSESLFAVNEPVLSSEDSEKVVKILNGFITGAAALMGMVTSFITMFLYPGWVNGTLFGLQDYLKIIWILISNIVYFIFAFILIAIAFMNIIGKGEGTWELKQAMPKFIVGILIVPFSWFFVQFILSISAILTVGVLTLPYDSFNGTASFDAALAKPEFAGKEICKDVIISFNGDFTGYQTTSVSNEANDLDENIQCNADGGVVTIKELITGLDENGNPSSASGLQNSIFGVMSIYSYGILSIDKLDTITGTDLESVETIADLVFKIVFDVLFIAVYLLLMIALLLALFVRGVRLWVYMMLSPTFGLLYFFGKGTEGVGADNTKFSIKEFIDLALVPVYVSAALAFGLIFILVASNGITEQNPDKNTLEAGGFSLTILGAHGEGESEASVIGKLIIQMFGIVILWISVMAALKSSTTTGNIVEPIAAFGKSVGDLASKAPTYAPIIPTPGGGLQSAASLQTIGSQIQSKATTQQTDRASQFFGGGSESAETSRKLQNTATNLSNYSGDARNTIKSLREGLEGLDTQKLLGNKTQTAEMLNTAARNLQIDEAEIEKFRFDSRQGIANAIGSIDAAAEKQGADLFEGTYTRPGELTFTELDKFLGNTSNPPETTTPASPTSNTFNVQIGSDIASTPAEAVTILNANSRTDLDEKMRIANIPAEYRPNIVTAYEESLGEENDTV